MVNLNVKITGEENLELNIKGIKNNNEYKYLENDITVVVKISDKEVNIMRKCNDYNINLVFVENEETISTYSVFGGRKKFLLNTRTHKLEITDNSIIIEYDLEGNSFKYLLEVI